MRETKFEEVELGAILEKVSNPVDVKPDGSYRQIGIRSHGKGLFDKAPVTGVELGDKRVFWVEPDCFVVNIVFAWEQAVGRTTKEDVGKVASHRFPMYRPKNGKSDVDFISYLFKTAYGKDLLTLASPGGAGRNKTLGQSEFLKLRVRIPPASEQRRIGEILSTWDRAIETVEALIANARTQKSALMGQLLTGKRRLAGFSSDWRRTQLDQAARIIVSNVDKKSDANEEPIRLCNYMDVYRWSRINADMLFMRATAAPAQISKFALKVGDVLITKDSETPDDIAIPAYVETTAPDLVCGYHLAIVRPRTGTDGRFLKYYFEDRHTRHHFMSRANGATRFGLTIDAIEGAPISVPPLEEQRQIAEVILTAELEEEHLQPVAAALRQEKAALMQQLLTGKRRVRIAEGAHG